MSPPELHRYGPSCYYVICEKGHRFGVVDDNPTWGQKCCYKSMLGAFIEAYERLFETGRRVNK